MKRIGQLHSYFFLVGWIWCFWQTALATAGNSTGICCTVCKLSHAALPTVHQFLLRQTTAIPVLDVSSTNITSEAKLQQFIGTWGWILDFVLWKAQRGWKNWHQLTSKEFLCRRETPSWHRCARSGPWHKPPSPTHLSAKCTCQSSALPQPS